MEEKQNTHIYPIFDRMMTREDKERLLRQRSVMVWFTGLSGSGKSTVAIALERELHKRGLLCRILDGDNIRSGINNNLGFSAEDRVENIRRIAEVSKLFIDTGVITIAAFISPNNDLREMAAVGLEVAAAGLAAHWLSRCLGSMRVHYIINLAVCYGSYAAVLGGLNYKRIFACCKELNQYH